MSKFEITVTNRPTQPSRAGALTCTIDNADTASPGALTCAPPNVDAGALSCGPDAASPEIREAPTVASRGGGPELSPLSDS